VVDLGLVRDDVPTFSPHDLPPLSPLA